MSNKTDSNQSADGTPEHIWILRIALPLIIIFVALFSYFAIVAGRASPQRQAPPRPAPVVEVITAKAVDHTITVASQGTVEARTTGSLQPEVAGKVVSIGPSFRDGGFFIAGETLLQIDDREFRAQLAISRAEIARNQLALNQEQARGRQARNDFKRLGDSLNNRKPTTLGLRKPQLEAAKADLAAARARLDIAELAIERSRIVAPYNGRIVNQNVDVGQYVTPATVLASIYATDAVEVRLPLADSKLRYLDLPERAGDPQPEVMLTALVAGKPQRWEARLVRTEGSIDETSRQRVAIAQLTDPFAEAGRAEAPIKIGQFVEAKIDGERLSNVVVLPVTALAADEQSVFAVSNERTLQRLAAPVLWRSGEQLVVEAGELDGKRIVEVPPTFATDGMKVQLPGERPVPQKKRSEGESAIQIPQPAEAKPAKQAGGKP